MYSSFPSCNARRRTAAWALSGLHLTTSACCQIGKAASRSAASSAPTNEGIWSNGSWVDTPCCLSNDQISALRSSLPRWRPLHSAFLFGIDGSQRRYQCFVHSLLYHRNRPFYAQISHVLYQSACPLTNLHFYRQIRRMLVAKVRSYFWTSAKYSCAIWHNVPLWRSKPRTGIKCPNIKFELEKGLGRVDIWVFAPENPATNNEMHPWECTNVNTT